MMHSFTQKLSLFLMGTLVGALVLLTGCGKNESAGGLVGGAAGAAIGASVSKDSGTGALIGGLAGTLLGSTVGRAADEEEQEEIQERQARIRARQDAEARHKINSLENENRKLRQKWCNDCSRQVTLTDASSCPSCGGALIRERYCRECTQTFSPASGYRYCPYCKPGTPLKAR